MLSEEVKKIKIPNEMVRSISLACLQPISAWWLLQYCVLFGKSVFTRGGQIGFNLGVLVLVTNQNQW